MPKPHEIVRDLMARMKINKAELSRRAGIPDSLISRLFKGKTFGPNSMDRLCAALKAATAEELNMLKSAMLELRAESRYRKVMSERIAPRVDKTIQIEDPTNVVIIDFLSRKLRVTLDVQKDNELYIEVMDADEAAKIRMDTVIKLDE